jgi:hypothetical protein
VLAVIGEPFDVSDMRELYHDEQAAAVRTLTDRIAASLHDLTLNVAAHRDAELIDSAERLYAREKGVSGWRKRDPLAERLPRMRAFARGLDVLRERDPERHARLARAVARYRRRAQLLGAEEGDVPPRYTFAGTFRYVMTNGVLLLLLALPALVGAIIWYPTYLAPYATLRLVRPDYEAIATYKLATGFIAVPLTMALGIVVGLLLAGLRGAAAAALILPAAGFAALAWHDRWTRFRDDALLFIRVLGRRDHRQRLARDRSRLVAEFDELASLATEPAGL